MAEKKNEDLDKTRKLSKAEMDKIRKEMAKGGEQPSNPPEKPAEPS